MLTCKCKLICRWNFTQANSTFVGIQFSDFDAIWHSRFLENWLDRAILTVNDKSTHGAPRKANLVQSQSLFCFFLEFEFTIGIFSVIFVVYRIRVHLQERSSRTKKASHDFDEYQKGLVVSEREGSRERGEEVRRCEVFLNRGSVTPTVDVCCSSSLRRLAYGQQKYGNWGWQIFLRENREVLRNLLVRSPKPVLDPENRVCTTFKSA